MARISLYRTYRYVDKDPIIDKMRTLVQDEGLFKKLNIVHQLSGVSTSTLENWFHGDTKSPQNRTICAVITALGYEHSFSKVKQLDIEKELKVAAKWYEQQNSADNKKPKKSQPKTSRPANGHAQRTGVPR